MLLYRVGNRGATRKAEGIQGRAWERRSGGAPDIVWRMALYNVFLLVSGIVAVAGVVALFWLVITAIRAMNLYMEKTRIEIAAGEPLELTATGQ